MAFFAELLNGGLVTARDPSLLSPGELVEAAEAHYRPGSMGLHKVGARAAKRERTTEIYGLAYLKYDDGDHIAFLEDTKLYTIEATGVNAKGHVTGLSSGSRLHATHYENKYILSNGVDAPSLFTSALSVSFSASGVYPFGLNPPTGCGILNVYDIVPGHSEYVTTWNPDTFPGSGLGFYGLKNFYYWATEFISGLGMESLVTAIRFVAKNSATAEVYPFQAASQTNYVLKFSDTAKNSKATHRRVYRAVTPPNTADLIGKGIIWRPFQNPNYNKISATAGVVPLIGELVTTLPISVTTYTDYGMTTGLPFAGITVDVQGITTTTPRDGKPPIFDTGDIFNDSFVCNDKANKHLVRYSYPGSPWSFPSIYYLPMSPNQRDEVTLVRSIGTICIVGLKNSLYRLNYLPRESDAEFNRGRAFELVGKQGVTGPLAADVFSMEGTTPMLAFVSYSGIWLTDGYRIHEATRDLDWENTVEQSQLTNACLVNMPDLWTLIFYYTPKGGTANTKALYLSYHPIHLKEGGRLSVTGPVTQVNAAGSSHEGRVRTYQASYGYDNTLYTASFLSATAGGAYEGYIFKEDQTPIAANPMSIKTRIIYPGNLDTDVQVQRVYTLFKKKSAAFTDSLRLISRKADQTLDSITGSFHAVSAGIVDRFAYPFYGEAFQAHLTGNNIPILIGLKIHTEEIK